MKEFIVASSDIAALKEELAVSVVRKQVTQIEVSDNTSTRTVYFLVQEVSSEGMNDGDVFFGLASGSSADPEKMSPARIETEDSILVLIAEL